MMTLDFLAEKSKSSDFWKSDQITLRTRFAPEFDCSSDSELCCSVPLLLFCPPCIPGTRAELPTSLCCFVKVKFGEDLEKF